MNGFGSHPRISTRRSVVYSVAVFAFLIIITYFFAVLQFSFVASPATFWAIICALIVSSFISTVMEAAFSTITTDENSFAAGISAEMDEVFEKRSHLEGALSFVPTRAQSKEMQRLHKKSRKLKSKHRLASGIDRSAIVGSFATLSVFLNTSIAIFLPLSMQRGVGQLLTIPVPSAVEHMACTIGKIGCGVTGLDLTSEKLFLLATSTIPLLILGKIVPKAIGMNFPSPWLTRLSWLAPVVMMSFGWISVGCGWFFDRKRS
jgi:uncharacterized membrane protein (DUF106 family)